MVHLDLRIIYSHPPIILNNSYYLHAITVESLDTQEMSAGSTLVSPMLLPNLMVIVIIAISMDTKNISVDLSSLNHLRGIYSMDIAILVISLDTSHMNANHIWRLTKNWERVEMQSIGVIIHGVHVIHMESMVKLLQIAWDYTLEEDLVIEGTLKWHIIIVTRSIF